MNKIESMAATSFANAHLAHVGARCRGCGGHTHVTRAPEKGRTELWLYNTRVLAATGTPSDYRLFADVGHFTNTTRSRVNAALEGLGVGLRVRCKGGEPLWTKDGTPVGGKRANGYCPVFSVINGEVLA